MTEQSMVRLLRADKGNQPVFIYLVHLCRRDTSQITQHEVRALQNDKVHIIGRASRRALLLKRANFQQPSYPLGAQAP